MYPKLSTIELLQERQKQLEAQRTQNKQTVDQLLNRILELRLENKGVDMLLADVSNSITILSATTENIEAKPREGDR